MPGQAVPYRYAERPIAGRATIAALSVLHGSTSQAQDPFPAADSASLCSAMTLEGGAVYSHLPGVLVWAVTLLLGRSGGQDHHIARFLLPHLAM